MLLHPLPGYPTPKGGGFGASRGFDRDMSPVLHMGHDWSAPNGTPVRAAAGGTVIHLRWGDDPWHIGAGVHMHIAHSSGLQTRYVHLSNAFVREGDSVLPGQTIGAVGSTGWSTGPHLHFEVLVRGKHVDPLDWIVDGSGFILDVTAIAQRVADIIGGATSLITRIVDSVKGTIVNVVQPIVASIAGVLGTITQQIGSVVSALRTTLNNLIGTVTSAISGVIKGMTNVLSSIASSVTQAAQHVLTRAASAIAEFIGSARTAVGNAIASIGTVVGGIVRTVQTTVGNLINTASNVIGNVGGFVLARVRDALGFVLEGAEFLVNRITGLPAAIVGFADDVLRGMGDSIMAAAGGVAEFLADPVQGLVGGFFEAEEDELAARIGPMVDRLLGNSSLPKEFRPIAFGLKNPRAPIWGLVLALSMPVVIGTVVGSALQPAVNLMVQEENAALRPTLLSLGDLTNGMYRDEVSRGQVFADGAKLGYSDDDIRHAIEVGRPLPTVGDIVLFWHRNLIDRGQASDMLAQHGFTAATIFSILQAAEVLPPLQDLVRMAVREAFPGQVAYEGSAGQGVPGNFVEAVKLQGVEAEWARSYWAAHWELPSPQQGFEMFHRGIISSDQLRGLLVALDIMPEWRDSLSAIAYNPLTRVDIRRMYALGILDRGGLVRAHLDLGYSPTDAERLTEFVVQLEAESHREAEAPQRDLTRADLVGAYEDAIITRPDLLSNLLALGYDENEAELIADRSDIAAERKRRADIKKHVTELAVRAVISSEEAEDRLNQAGLSTEEVALTLARIPLEREATKPTPTRADLFRFHKARQITDAELGSELAALGYDERWVNQYVSLSKKGQAPLEN